MSRKKIKVLLADDHIVVRMGLKAIINIESDLEVVGEAGNGEEALKLTAKLNPDVAIVDLLMPKMNGVDATSAISQNFQSTKVLILTSFSDSNEVGRAIAAGALGALAKDSSPTDIISAIRDVAMGKKSISPEIAAAISVGDNKLQLSPRQIEMLHYAAKGLTNADISRILGIGVDCVKAHMKTAFSRLGASNRSEAVAIAIRHKLISL